MLAAANIQPNRPGANAAVSAAGRRPPQSTIRIEKRIHNKSLPSRFVAKFKGMNKAKARNDSFVGTLDWILLF